MQQLKGKRNKNIMLTLMYDGTSFNGWQRLNNVKDEKENIQGLLERVLSDITEQDIQVIGSGRTDAGVHALQQVCNFYTSSELKVWEIQQELNHRLPEELRVIRATQTKDNFHSRYDAVSKVYEYRIDVRERERVFSRKYTYPAYRDLNIEHMQQAANYLVGTHDFKAFSTDRKDGKPTIRTIHKIHIYRVTDHRNLNEVRIECTGDGFLHHMVRIIAGTLLEVGTGQRIISSVPEALNSRERKNAGILLSPQGLFLNKVNY
jgi:tRNA pseudouridine38-40 synthase